MQNFPGLVDQGHEIICSPSGVSPYYNTVAASATVNTKGSWVTIGTCPSGYDAVPTVVIHGTPNDTGTYLVDFGINGISGWLLSNLFYSIPNALGFEQHYMVTLPVRILAGQNLQARCAADGAYDALWMSVIFHPIGAFNSSQVLSISETWGSDASSTRGTELDPGTTQNQKATTYTTVVASTTADTKGFLIAVGRRQVGSYGTSQFRLDIAIGASSNEVVIVEDFGLTSYSNGGQPEPRISPFFPIAIPAGTRVSARTQCSVNTDPSRFIDIVMYGFY